MDDLCEQLRRGRTINDELERNVEKTKYDLSGKADSMSKEMKKTKKKLVELEKNAGEITTERDRVIAECDEAITDRNQLKDDLEYIQEQTCDISTFGYLALDGIPKDIAHIITAWIENNPKILAEKREEWKKEREGDEADEGMDPSEK